MKRFVGIVLFITLSFGFGANAVEPDEVLADPALEARARDLSSELRCLVCQNQSIDDSDAELARDLRLLVRKRLLEGDSNEQVIDYVVSRYGDFVLLKPSFTAKNLVLWVTPGLVLVFGGIFAFRRFHTPADNKVTTPLSDHEKDKLKQLLDE